MSPLGEKKEDKKNMGDYWDDMMIGLFNYARDAYSSMQPWDYGLFFAGLIVFVFLVTQSATAAGAFILIIVGLYGTNILLSMPDLMLIMYIIVLIVFTSLFAFLFIKRRN